MESPTKSVFTFLMSFLASVSLASPANATAGSQCMKLMMGAARKMMKNHNPPLAIDEAFCSSGAGALSLLLDGLGYQRGADYQLVSGNTHVYVAMLREDQVVDLTFAQFFTKGSASHREILDQNGFYGTRDDLEKYLVAHQIDSSIKSELRTQLDSAFKKNPEEYLKILRKGYFGTNTDKNSSYLIEIAYRFSDSFQDEWKQTRSDPLFTQHPDLVKPFLREYGKSLQDLEKAGCRANVKKVSQTITDRPTTLETNSLSCRDPLDGVSSDLESLPRLLPSVLMWF